MNKALLAVSFVLLMVVFLLSDNAYAGNVQNYQPDVPLINTSQGIIDKVNYLCKEAKSDLTRYSDVDLESFMKQTDDTRDAIYESTELNASDKNYYDRKVASCDLYFARNLQSRYQAVYRGNMERVNKLKDEMKEIEKLKEDSTETIKQMRSR